MSRLVTVHRDRVARRELLYLGDVSCDRLRRDQVLVAQRRRNFLRIEVAARAVALQGSEGARVAGVGIALRYLHTRQGVVGVGARRG